MKWTEIESKSYIYSLYKSNSLTYKLVTYKPIAGGIDIIHFLTESEIEKYEKIGIESLNERINDMHNNFNKYKINSWR